VPQTPLIAIVDDGASVCEAIQGLVEAFGFAAEAFSSAEAFLLPGMSGLQLQNHLSVSGSGIPIIVITAFAGDDRQALAAGAICFLPQARH
jgi:FixJ family two-component response regulator